MYLILVTSFAAKARQRRTRRVLGSTRFSADIPCRLLGLKLTAGRNMMDCCGVQTDNRKRSHLPKTNRRCPATAVLLPGRSAAMLWRDTQPCAQMPGGPRQMGIQNTPACPPNMHPCHTQPGAPQGPLKTPGVQRQGP
jgi:hypothetical protein